MDKIIVLISSAALVGLIIWWFFARPQSEVVAASGDDRQQSVEITVEGGYSPQVVSLRQGVPAKLVFTRRDKSSCLEEVVLPDFGIRQKLPVDQPYEINLTPDKPGQFQYACGMNMFFGTIEVK
ncbi:MAG TPA: cupredoxin domain-containing protein [Candidatus Saccharimonadales bacterium]|nr:cupredoxin domain-containing protein [Candidatus Saccharimonadales bacterium]